MLPQQCNGIIAFVKAGKLVFLQPELVAVWLSSESHLDNIGLSWYTPQDMATPDQDVQEGRNKRTILLLAGGAVSLALPLLGVVYIRMGEMKTARPPDSSIMFDRRENGETKVNISQTVTIINPAAQAGTGTSSLPVAKSPIPSLHGSSLDFIKSDANSAYFQDKPASASATGTPTTPTPAPTPEPERAPVTAARKGGKKAFNMPKLRGTKSFSSFKGGSPKPLGSQGLTEVADPQAGKGGMDMADMLKNVPGGANNPEVQKYLKSQDK